jgi:hypothetical protein
LARGGKRPGAGRRIGSASKRTREIADKAAANGMTPLEVMLRAMKEHADALRWDQAASVAKDAAPYIHPRLAAVMHAGAPSATAQTVDMSAQDIIASRIMGIIERTRG